MNRFNCHGNICPGNICPGDNCPYQEYLSCYSPDFDQILKVGSWDHLEQIPTIMVTFIEAIFFMVTFDHFKNISAGIDKFFNKLFGISFLGALILLDHNFVPTKFFWIDQFFRPKLFGTNIFNLTFFLPVIFLDQHFLLLQFFITKMFVSRNTDGPKKFEDKPIKSYLI